MSRRFPNAHASAPAACGFAIPLVITAALAVLPGCSANPQAAPRVEPPPIDSVRSDMPERAERLAGDQFELRGLAKFQQVQLPLDKPTDAAWDVVDETVFPAITRGVWNSNGLRIGLLPRHKLADFMDRLPRATGMGQSQLMGSEHPSPILRTPRLHGVVDVDLTIPPMPVRLEPVTGGRLQMLARLTRDHRGVLVVDLLPHHHVPQLKLPEVRKVGDEFIVIPRDAMEKELDGRIFTELAVRADVPATSLLVIGLYRPWPETPAEGAPPPPEPIVPPDMVAPPPLLEGEQIAAPAGAEQQVQADAPPATPEGDVEGPPATPPAATPTPAAPPLPNHLGRALFAGVSLGQPQQTILLISVEPLGGTPASFTPPAAPAPPQP